VFGQWTGFLFVHTGPGNLIPTDWDTSNIEESSYSVIYPASNRGACLNPAIALAIAMVSPIQEGTTYSDSWQYIWLYPVMPFVGSLLAVLYYEIVFKKAE
jgi:hypothetical protein